MKSIQEVDLTQCDQSAYAKHFVGCLILTHDNKVLLQQRDNNWLTYPGCLATFGGRIEVGESPAQALIRELAEELGAKVTEVDLIDLGAITEEITRHTELVYVYFWHDKVGTISDCCEGEAKSYASVADALAHPKIMDDVRWLLNECRRRNLIP